MSERMVELELESRGGDGVVATITVANPQRLNALSSLVVAHLQVRIAEVAENGDVRVVVLQGAGERAFIGGADITELANLDQKTARSFITSIHEVCSGLRELSVPVVAKIRGYCLGAGLEIAASCDLRVATEQSQFGMPEVQLGLPSVIEAALLPQLIGWGRTRELVFGGRSFMASEVASWGLVERVVPASEIDRAVDEWVESIVRADANAIRLQKELIRKWERLPLEEAIAAGIEAFAEAYGSDAPIQRAQNFLNRRGGSKS